MIQSGRVDKKYTSKNIEYIFSIEVTDAERDSYLVPYGSSIGQYQTDYPFDSIVCIDSIAKGMGANRWLITYYGANTTDFNFAIVPQKTNMSYSSGEFQFTPDMLGCRRATSLDVGKKGMDGSAAKEGDWIYNDASSTSAGTVSLANCPFTDVGFASGAFASTLLTIKMPTVNYSIRFPDPRASVSQFAKWFGINGTFGSGLAPSDTTTGIWIARKSHTEQVKNGVSTTQYCERTMETAPIVGGIQLKFKPTLYPTWTW